MGNASGERRLVWAWAIGGLAEYRRFCGRRGLYFYDGLRIRFYTIRSVWLVAGGKSVLLHGLALFVASAGVWFADFKRGIHLAAAFGAAHRTLRCVERSDIGSNFVPERFEQ